MALTGFWVNGVCAASQADAVDLLNSQFPVVTGALFHSGSAVANGTTGALLSVWTFNLSAVGGTYVNHNLSFNFSSCDPVLHVGSVFDPVIAGAFWSFAMTFVFGCWLLAKNAGAILAAIKKF